jgi:hypothetical protein
MNEVSLKQKLLIAAIVGAMIGLLSTFAHDRLHKGFVKMNGLKNLKG